MSESAQIYFEHLRQEIWAVFDTICMFDQLFSFDDHAETPTESAQSERWMAVLPAKSILERVAPEFFASLNDILHRYYVLQTARLADPAQSKVGKGQLRQNLTIKGMNEHLDDLNLLSQRIENLSKEILEHLQSSAVPPRHSLIAHNDLLTHLNGAVLGGSSREEADTFLKNLQKYSNEVGIALGVGPSDYVPNCPGDGSDLMSALDWSCKIRDCCVSSECPIQKYDIRPTRY